MQKTELGRAVLRQRTGHPQASLGTVPFFQAHYQWGQLLDCFDVRNIEGGPFTYTTTVVWKSHLYRYPVLLQHDLVT